MTRLKTRYRSKKKMIIRSEEEDVYIIPEKNLFLLPTKDLMATIQGTINISTTGTAIFGGVGLTALGQKGKALGIVPAPSNKMGGAYDGVLEIGDLVATGQSLRDAIDGIIENVTRPFEEESKFEEVKFRFLSSDKYNLKENEDFIPMTIAQQNEQAFGFLDLKEWEEEEIEDTLPYPGKDKFASFYATSKLTNLQNLENSDTSSKDTASLTNKAESIQFESLQTYKILES
jgi:PHD/YefM family antitoxin component YafN of YafNO toxin-antitoxin module